MTDPWTERDYEEETYNRNLLRDNQELLEELEGYEPPFGGYHPPKINTLMTILRILAWIGYLGGWAITIYGLLQHDPWKAAIGATIIIMGHLSVHFRLTRW